MHLLVVGGAGYIGSIVSEVLLRRGHRVTILDNFSTGHPAAVPEGAALVLGELEDPAVLDRALAGVDAVMHFAAKIVVPESMERPGLYFANNVAVVVGLVNAMLDRGVRRLVFSSSAAVYGEPEQVPITEDAPVRPNNPYGETKAMVEQMLRWYASQAGLRYAALRYFNAAGASQRRGEDHPVETHLIPLAVRAAQRGAEFTLYGDDYPTPDGTAVRDYIHVLDLAEAHALALEHLDEGSLVCNLGTARGYSVREVVDAVRSAGGRDISVRIQARRPGDPPCSVASYQRAEALLGWRPERGLSEIVGSAWRWHLAHPNGYAGREG